MSNRRNLRTKSPPNRSRSRPRKLIDRLGETRPMVKMTVASLAIGIVSLGATFYFGLWSNSPGPVTGKPIPTTTGGQNPTPLFRGQQCANVQKTEIILFSLQSVLSCASPLKFPAVMVFGSSNKRISYCASSYAMRRPGVYRCEIQVNGGVNTIADPCFGLHGWQVECELPDGSFGLLDVVNIDNVRPYHPSLSEVGPQYPFRLELDNGMTCTWNWLPFMDHTGGGWICAAPLAIIEFQPTRDHQLLKGRDALNYNGWYIRGTSDMYYAEDLTQGSLSTWSVLLEGPNNPGIFTRESVAQAWY